MGETKPLRDFVKAGKSVPQANVFVAGESIPMRVRASVAKCRLRVGPVDLFEKIIKKVFKRRTTYQQTCILCIRITCTKN